MSAMKMRPGGALVALLPVLSLSGCGSMLARNPAGRLKPVNAVAEGENGGVMLKVPHYQSGAELARAVADARSKAK